MAGSVWRTPLGVGGLVASRFTMDIWAVPAPRPNVVSPFGMYYMFIGEAKRVSV